MSELDQRPPATDGRQPTETTKDDAAESLEQLSREPLLKVSKVGSRTYIRGEIDLEQLAQELDASLAQRFSEFCETAEYSAQTALLDFMALCHARKTELGLSDADLARAMDVSRSYMSRVMNATPNLTVVSLAKLAKALRGKIRINLVIDD